MEGSHVVFRPQTCNAGSFSEFGIHQYQHMNLIGMWQPDFDIEVSDELLMSSFADHRYD